VTTRPETAPATQAAAIPWEEPPSGERSVVWRSSRNPIIPRDLIPPVEELARLPFAGPARPGQLFHTLLIEPPRYLPALLSDVDRLGVVREQGELGHLAEALREPERVIVNALGLGAGTAADDAAVLPLRGQLVHLEPEDLGYLLSHDVNDAVVAVNRLLKANEEVYWLK